MRKNATLHDVKCKQKCFQLVCCNLNIIGCEDSSNDYIPETCYCQVGRETYFLAVSYRFNEFLLEHRQWFTVSRNNFSNFLSRELHEYYEDLVISKVLGDSDSAFFYARRTLQLVQLGFHLIWNLTSLHIFTFKQWRWHDTSFSLPQQLASLPPWTYRAPSGSPIPWKMGQLEDILDWKSVHQLIFFANMSW